VRQLKRKLYETAQRVVELEYSREHVLEKFGDEILNVGGRIHLPICTIPSSSDNPLQISQLTAQEPVD